MNAPSLRSSVLAVATLAAALAGCRGGPSEDPPILLIRNMFDQPKYMPQSKSDYFEDGRTMRTPVEGTLARGRYVEDPEIESGRTADGAGYVMMVPPKLAERWGGMDGMLARGRERFGIYCSPCHDKAGTGNGTVVQRGLQKPPSLHDPRVREMPDGQLFATITHGVRNMPAYAAQIPMADRWAIVSYVRALELSQLSMNTTLEPKK